jgi:3-deoxy-D-manno-octulosonate 8-phosphate phosphatase (KDO 8-P phosphatase)
MASTKKARKTTRRTKSTKTRTGRGTATRAARGAKSKKKAARKGVRRAMSAGARARRAAASAAEKISPAVDKVIASATEAITALRQTAASAGRAVDRGGAATRPIQRARSVLAETLHRLEPRIRPMRLLLLDVDGVLTDGGIYYAEGGEEMKRFHIQDGMGVDLLLRAGIEVGILTGRRSTVVERRGRELGMRIVKQGFYGKSAGFAEILEEENLSPEEVGYVGDDIQDLPVFKQVGFRAAPSNAVREVQAEVDYVCSRVGGDGAVREIAELILTALGKKDEIIAAAASAEAEPLPGREFSTSN